jgi:hypothetical protein
VAAHLDQKAAANQAAQGAAVLVKRLEGSETDSYRLSRLGSALAALAARFDSGLHTRRIALSNLFLGTISSKGGRSRDEEARDRARISATCQSLDAKELTEVLKWPLCVGDVQELVFAELKKKIEAKSGQVFAGNVSKFIEQIDSLGLGIDRNFLNQPPKRAQVEDALKELEAT